MRCPLCKRISGTDGQVMAQLEVVGDRWHIAPTEGIHARTREIYRTEAVWVKRFDAVKIEDTIGAVAELNCRRPQHPTFRVPATWLIREGRKAVTSSFQSITIPEKFGTVLI